MKKAVESFELTIQKQLEADKEAIKHVSDIRENLKDEAPETLRNMIVYYRTKEHNLSVENENTFALLASGIAILALIADTIITAESSAATIVISDVNIASMAMRLLLLCCILLQLCIILKHHRDMVKVTKTADVVCMIAEELLQENKQNNRKVISKRDS